MSTYNSKRTFTHKGYGRIYVMDETHIPMVNHIISEMYQEEFENYMPKDLIAPFSK